MNIAANDVKSILDELFCNSVVTNVLAHCNNIDVWQLVGCVVCDSVQILLWHD